MGRADEGLRGRPHLPLEALEAPPSPAEVRAAYDALWEVIQRGEGDSGPRSATVLRVLKQTRRAHDDGWLADGDGRRVSGMGSVLAKAARQLQRQVEEAEAA